MRMRRDFQTHIHHVNHRANIMKMKNGTLLATSMLYFLVATILPPITEADAMLSTKAT